MLVGMSKSTQNKLVGIAQGAFKTLFSLVLPFGIASIVLVRLVVKFSALRGFVRVW